MFRESRKINYIKACSQGRNDMARVLDPDDFFIENGYAISVFAQGLDTPVGLAFSEDGTLYIADSGINTNNPKILRIQNGQLDTIAEGFSAPITGINYYDGGIYISDKGYITVLRENGTRLNILAGLPCNGDFLTSNVAFGPDGKIYFGQGTVTNSGVVGYDNPWVFTHPFLHDQPAVNIALDGQNFRTVNMFTTGEETAYTGAFSAYGVPNSPGEVRKGILKASGSILKMNRDGTEMELVASGLRNPVHIQFDRNFRLLVANRGYDVRGSRPIANSPDEFHIITPGVWYGWPDFSGGEPVTLEKFRPEGGIQPQFLLLNHPNIPPKPFAVFLSHTTITGFDINYSRSFGAYGDVFITEHGSFGPITMGQSAAYEGVGNKVSRINMTNGEVSTFINNKSGIPVYTGGEGGFGRPVDIAFGPDGAMYVLDIGVSDRRYINQYIPNTGVIWKVVRL